MSREYDQQLIREKLGYYDASSSTDLLCTVGCALRNGECIDDETQDAVMRELRNRPKQPLPPSIQNAAARWKERASELLGEGER